MSEKTIALIDSDSLIYHSSKDTLTESIEVLNEKFNNILEQTNADYYLTFVSLGKYFRHQIDPLYKKSRTNRVQPLKFVNSLKNYLIEQYNAVAGSGVEADDLISYYMNKNFYTGTLKYSISTEDTILSNPVSLNPDDFISPEKVNKIMCAVDKDLLQSIPGKHFNYTYRLEDKNNPESVIKGWWIETSIEDSSFFIWEQMVQGGLSPLFI